MRIMILGDSGRGKTTLAKNLSKKLNIKFYSTDDFFWDKKFTIRSDIDKSVKKISKLYDKKDWIIEGTTCHLLKPGMNKADLILHLRYKNIFSQLWTVWARGLQRKDGIIPTIKLMHYLFLKRYKLSYCKHKVYLDDLLKGLKTIELHNYKEIDDYLDRFK